MADKVEDAQAKAVTALGSLRIPHPIIRRRRGTSKVRSGIWKLPWLKGYLRLRVIS